MRGWAVVRMISSSPKGESSVNDLNKEVWTSGFRAISCERRFKECLELANDLSPLPGEGCFDELTMKTPMKMVKNPKRTVMTWI